MPKIHVTNVDGAEAEINARSGFTLMEVLKSYNYTAIEAACGGSCSCATCHVALDDAWYAKLGAPSETEDELLSTTPERHPTSRLSCQILLSDEMEGLRVRVAMPGAA